MSWRFHMSGVLMVVGVLWGSGCTYVGTPRVESRMIDRIVSASNRLEMGMSRDEAMRLIPAGEKTRWGMGVAQEDPSIEYEEWRVFAEDSMDRVDERDEIRFFELWLYFVGDELYLKSTRRVPFEEQDEVHPTWRRGGRFDVVGSRVDPGEGGGP